MRIRRRPGGGRPLESGGQAGFRTALLAARNTQYYRLLLEYAGLGSVEQIAALPSLDQALARLPKVEPGLVRMDSHTLRNDSAPQSGPGSIHWPLPQPGRTALLGGGPSSQAGIKTFRDTDLPGLERWSPDALAGPVPALRRLAELVRASKKPEWLLGHSVLAFMTVRGPFLTEPIRELFWEVWRAPVFGQVFGASGELLAWECEAHEGYHYKPDEVFFELDAGDGPPELLVTSLAGLRYPMIRLATLLTGELETVLCGCGVAGPRLVGLRPRRSARAAFSAASGC